MVGHKYRFNWNSPIELSPQDPSTVYFGGNVLFRTTNDGQSWDVISPDLTTNDQRSSSRRADRSWSTTRRLSSTPR